MKLRKRDCSRSYASEMRRSCSAGDCSMPSACFIWLCRRLCARNIFTFNFYSKGRYFRRGRDVGCERASRKISESHLSSTLRISHSKMPKKVSVAKAKQASAAPVPNSRDLLTLRKAAKTCKACPLWLRGTQTVFGEGSAHAHVMFVGEQPGDKEDLEGRPFVGPAGAVLDKALEEAGIDRNTVYVSNAVKHFKWEPRGKRRIHKKPNAMEIAACRPWLDAEIEAVRPDVIVCLGATAAQGLLGKQFRVTKSRGEIIEAEGKPMLATVHPSSILRAPADETRRLERQKFVDDLRVMAEYLGHQKNKAA